MSNEEAIDILVADDDPIYRRLLESGLKKGNYRFTIVENGEEAWSLMRETDHSLLAILDWMMPGLEGVEVCRRLREVKDGPYIYVILLTAKKEKEDIAAGLDAGADDYLVKPFDQTELHARIRVGLRLLDLQNSLKEHVCRLEEALSRVKRLHGLLPICAYCKRVRTDQDYWDEVEEYIAEHTEVRFSHGICPECYEKIIKPQLGKSTSKRLLHEEAK